MNNEELKNITLLYAEDDEMVRKNAVEYLERVCKTVYEAKDGNSALTIWRDKKPDIIITDINMPKLNGLDMIKYIRESDKTTQIIITSGYSDTSYLLQAVELQLVKYIIKPITTQKLLDALNISVNKINGEKNKIVNLGEDYIYNAATEILSKNSHDIKLTKNEILFLNLLCINSQRAVKYEEIENKIWPYDGMSQDAIKSLVRALRKKVPKDSIQNISGIGYKLNESPL